MESLLSFLKTSPDTISKEQLAHIIEHISDDQLTELMEYSLSIKEKYYGKSIYLRALIEISSYCKQNCYYCGLRAGNCKAQRYRLSKEQILECSEHAYHNLGYKTFVLQGGEDPQQNSDFICDIVRDLKEKYPDIAITLSLGEKSREEYQDYYNAGADRYLLRHEAASRRLYEHIHPESMSYDNRRQCLRWLKEIGFQTGAGSMVGLPTQTFEDLAEDLIFIRELQPHMVGIGPFLTHKDTPFNKEIPGTLRQTLIMLCLTRIILPKTLLPATTSLGTLDKVNGRRKGFLTGANVIMPNVSPQDVKVKYLLYDGKVGIGDQSMDFRILIENQLTDWGFEMDLQVGHSAMLKEISYEKNA